MCVILRAKNISKQYRLGQFGTGTISHDINRYFAKLSGKEDPYIKIGESNDRTLEGGQYVWALKNINFDVKEGEVIGIIGKNGAGKSTLLKLLSRVTGPTTGKIFHNGRIASLLEVGTGFHPELTGKENIFLNGAILGMKKHEIVSKLNDIIEFSGCAKYLDTPVKRYSSGMKVRLGFAVAAFLEPEILVVDEVLAVGDAEFQKKCIGKMKNVSETGRTILFVSHNMVSVRNLCSKVIVLDKGKIVFRGDVDEGIDYYLQENLGSDNSSSVFSYDLKKNMFISQVKLLSDTSVFEYLNDEIRFEVSVVNKILSPDLVLGFILEDEKGNKLIITASDDYELDLFKSEPKENYIIEISIPRAVLKPGRYYITLSLRGTGTNKYHKIDSEITFKIEDNITFKGLKGKFRENSVIEPLIEFNAKNA